MSDRIYPIGASSSYSSTQREDVIRGDKWQPNDDLLTTQTGLVVGGTIPLVFCMRRGSAGGAWISPPATEARFSNDAVNSVTAQYHLVISDSQIGTIGAQDVYQGVTKRSTFEQAYGRRAGSWVPGNLFQQKYIAATTRNTIDVTFPGTATFGSSGSHVIYMNVSWDRVGSATGTVAGFTFTATSSVNGISYSRDISSTTATGVHRATVRETNSYPYKTLAASKVCGTGGTYAGMSTLSVEGKGTEADPVDVWRQQFHVFVREGVRVTRLLDDTVGGSSLFPDLAYWLITQTAQVPNQLIDKPSFVAAAQFCQRNGIHFDGLLTSPMNVRELLTEMAPLHLLRVTQIGGKYGLRPLLPVDQYGAITTKAVTAQASFDISSILQGSYRRQYVDLADRKPFVALLVWRTQPTDTIGAKITTELRYIGSATNGPYETYDLSEFCTEEEHAVKVGKYILAKRRYVTHRVSFGTASASALGLSPGSIIRVTLATTDSSSTVTRSYYYEVDEVSLAADGIMSIAATHYPVTAGNISQVTADVLGGEFATDTTHPPGTVTIGVVTVEGSGAYADNDVVTLSAFRSGNSSDHVWTWTGPSGTTAPVGATVGNTLSWQYVAATDAGSYTATAVSGSATDSPKQNSARVDTEVEGIGALVLSAAGGTTTPGDGDYVALVVQRTGTADDVTYTWSGPAGTTAPIGTTTGDTLGWDIARATDSGQYTVTVTSPTAPDSPQTASITLTVGQAFVEAEGGTITTSGNYKIHTFKTDGWFTVTKAPVGSTVEYLIVGGGGAGARLADSYTSSPYIFAGGGGGGGGEVKTGNMVISKNSFPIVIGAGGQTATDSQNYNTSKPALSRIPSSASSALGLTASGGPSGIEYTTVGGNGVTGGGGSRGRASEADATWSYRQGGTGSAGGKGGDSIAATGRPTNTKYVIDGGGGGGGAGGAGGNVTYPTGAFDSSGGDGGVGITSDISGASVGYGGGGGGAGGNGTYGGSTRAGVGKDGGGAGWDQRSDCPANPDATPNTGGGGGGSMIKVITSTTYGHYRPGNGGSGIVIIRYLYR